MTTSYISRTKYWKYWLTLGIIGCLALLNPSAAQAEISVTGGRTAGDGAFFVPNQGNTLLFDINTRIIRLETPNGITVNSRFRPGGGRLDPMTGVPKGGETGFLEGTLSGRAFTAEGTPFFFQGVTTTLSFTLTSFDPNRVFEGTLIRSRSQSSTPLVFLEATDTSLADQSRQNFEGISGSLHIGEFSASLSGGAINLPADTQFAAPGIELIQFDGNTLAANANIKFELEGGGQGTTNLDAGQGSISYEGQTGKTNFTIQGTIDGIPDNSDLLTNQVSTISDDSSKSESQITVDNNSFKISGTISGPVNFAVGGLTNNGSGQNPNQSQSYTGDTQYKVSGVGQGSTEFNGREGSLNFYSPESSTNVEITGNGFVAQGSGTGEVSFNVGVGLISTSGSSGVSNGAVFGSSPTATSTDFGKGFLGLSLLPSRTETSDGRVVINIQPSPSSPEGSTNINDGNNNGISQQSQNLIRVLPTSPLPDSRPEVTIPTQPQPQPEVTIPTQPQPQPEVTIPTQPQPQPEVTIPTQPQPQPEVTIPTQPQPQPQPEAVISQPEEIPRQDPLAKLIEQVRNFRSQSDNEPLSPSFSQSIELQLRSVSGPRSRVFPGMEGLR